MHRLRLALGLGLGLALAAGLAAPPAASARIIRRAPTLHAHRHVGPTQPRLEFHGGSVMHSSTTYAVYWRPPGTRMAARYRATIDRFLGDVAADSGTAGNVHAVLAQYGDAAGAAAYDVRVGGSYLDRTPFPAGACKPYTGVVSCLTDAQVRAELRRVIRERGWTPGPDALFLLLTPADVGICEQRTGSSCAFTRFCAYHAADGRGRSTMIYAAIPYGATRPDACGIPQAPNAPAIDATINTLSHEHREAITDPLGDGWYDADGSEGSDKCAWWFGKQLGGTPGSQWNQLIHGRDYELQAEWSNAAGRCVLVGR